MSFTVGQSSRTGPRPKRSLRCSYDTPFDGAPPSPMSLATSRPLFPKPSKSLSLSSEQTQRLVTKHAVLLRSLSCVVRLSDWVHHVPSVRQDFCHHPMTLESLSGLHEVQTLLCDVNHTCQQFAAPDFIHSICCAVALSCRTGGYHMEDSKLTNVRIWILRSLTFTHDSGGWCGAGATL